MSSRGPRSPYARSLWPRSSSSSSLARVKRGRCGLAWLVPSIGLGSRDVELSVLALVGFGLATVAMRRATIFQILGIVLVENGLALAALELPGDASLAIEIGVATDLILVALVAAVFHERIFTEFGAGDSAALRTLRD